MSEQVHCDVCGQPAKPDTFRRFIEDQSVQSAFYRLGVGQTQPRVFLDICNKCSMITFAPIFGESK